MIVIKQKDSKVEVYNNGKLVVEMLSNSNITSKIEDLILLGQNNELSDIKIEG
ncbi:hypothetical protein [Clostridium magnum]|uniref:Uncharacterized protein n=1 Tax=Clostridium magnum DSM 2767 TaxID=1121326 RepID=A0A162QGF8_9CLOT|nr:hypothetical protein [Clostridium magnum]KZL88507.1 hypothetical protein CLMAG_61620 [Clostridium magnum DSM 2767]SHJ12244.1 hypothetical protein SAMN02745944_05382 [Clostridium magnum DSM 2767]